MKNSGADKKRILIVEDEPAICEVCRRALVGEGFEVDIAVNGEVAREMLGRKDYDLYLIDVRTPVMNGKELYRYISERHPELKERVIFTTGDILGGDTKGFVGQTGRPFLPKPFLLDELRTIIRETLKQAEK